MPATENLCQSIGCPQTYTLANDGRRVELRNGCVVDTVTRHTLANSREACQYLLTHCRLSDEQRDWLSYWGSYAMRSSDYTPQRAGDYARSKYGC